LANRFEQPTVTNLDPAPNPDDNPAALARRIAALAAEHKATDIRALDVRDVTLLADSFVLCSANSEPQLKAICNAIKDGMKDDGWKPLHSEGATSDGWIVLDFGVAIVHIFRVEAREFYQLDDLWGDAPAIALDGIASAAGYG